MQKSGLMRVVITYLRSIASLSRFRSMHGKCIYEQQKETPGVSNNLYTYESFAVWGVSDTVNAFSCITRNGK